MGTKKFIPGLLASLMLMLSFSLPAEAFQQSELQRIIPKPVSAEQHSGVFEITKATPVYLGDGSVETAKLGAMLTSLINSAAWYELEAGEGSPAESDTAIYLQLDKGGDYPHPEAYTLEIRENKVHLSSGSHAGLFYGIQTLRQLLPEEVEHTDPSLTPQNIRWTLPASTITDYPRFNYRGMHLDVARHFFDVEFVKHYIDLLAMHKMNRFHWHLTEDQGWRIEIKKYPKLTEIGAYRDSTLIGRSLDGDFDSVPHGGYYTQDEIREVVAYAKERYVTIIPEIEMPGHSSAALASYPELGCVDKDYYVQPTWGVIEDIYCPKEETFEFLENVLLEVMELFPGTYIHIGGDEAPKKQWKESKVAQDVMKREGLESEEELQSYFITRMEKFLNKHGRQIIGWDEILEGGLAPKATVMSWRGEAGGIKAAKMNHDVIMTPWDTNYFDHYQDTKETEPIAIGFHTTLRDVYHYDPIPEELNEEEAQYVLGAQGNVWTEFIHTPAKVEYMAYPRASALAEVLWTPASGKNWMEFWSRMQIHFRRFDIMGVNAAPHYDGKMAH